MNIKSDLPQITLLKRQVEQSIDFPLSTHGDFLRFRYARDRGCVFFGSGYRSKTQDRVGDTFSCIQFQKGRELHLEDYSRHGSPERYRYVAGINTGITVLEILQ